MIPFYYPFTLESFIIYPYILHLRDCCVSDISCPNLEKACLTCETKFYARSYHHIRESKYLVLTLNSYRYCTIYFTLYCAKTSIKTSAFNTCIAQNGMQERETYLVSARKRDDIWPGVTSLLINRYYATSVSLAVDLPTTERNPFMR